MISNIPTSLYGSCQCGAVQYCINQPPLVLYACHCTDCQRQSSSAFGLSLWVHKPAFSLIQGQLAIWSTTADSGNLKQCSFCGNCGTRIYHSSGDEDEILSIKAGTLTTTSWLKPAGHLWLSSAQPWFRPDHQQSLCYDTEPGDFTPLIEAWQDQFLL